MTERGNRTEQRPHAAAIGIWENEGGAPGRDALETKHGGGAAARRARGPAFSLTLTLPGVVPGVDRGRPLAGRAAMPLDLFETGGQTARIAALAAAGAPEIAGWRS